MADIIQDAPPVETVTPPPSEPVNTDSGTLSEHIEQFLEKPQDSDPTHPKRERHRSAKNFARSEDVPRIKELTREREEWKAKYEEAVKPKEPKVEQPTYQPPPQRQIPDAFDEPEPTLDKWIADGKDYDRYLRDAAAWDRKKEAFDAGKQYQTQQQQAAQQHAQQAVQAKAQKFDTSIQTYLREHPDRQAAFQSVPQNLQVSPLFAETVWSFADEPDVVYDLARNPALLAELHFLTDGKPASQEHVALTTQWLRSRLQAGTTGAAVRESPPQSPAPRPPTPVRTRPMPPVDGPPSDSGSLMEHNRYFKTAR